MILSNKVPIGERVLCVFCNRIFCNKKFRLRRGKKRNYNVRDFSPCCKEQRLGYCLKHVSDQVPLCLVKPETDQENFSFIS